MAIRKLKPRFGLTREEIKLKEAIKTEIRRPASQKPPQDAPVILEEDGIFPRTAHYHVIWDRFDGVDGESRYRVIYHAILEALGTRKAANATVLQGLTRKQAIEMGLEAGVG